MNNDEKKCPFCAEIIKTEAKVCRFCNRDLIVPAPKDTGLTAGSNAHEVQARSNVWDGVRLGCGMFIVLPILIVAGIIAFLFFFGSCAGIFRESENATSGKAAQVGGESPAPAPIATREESAGGSVPARVAVGKAGIQWVTFPGGSFMMGSDLDLESPQHKVTVPGFEMAKTLVTNKQYKACVDAGVCSPAHVSDGKCLIDTVPRNLPESFQGDDQPVVCVDWEQATVFSKWAGGRLPTEAEWEYAARSGGKEQKYPWGNQDWSCKRTTGVGISECPNGYRTLAVCSKPAGNTQQGLCDMAGNVRQWTQDWFHASYSGAPDDGSAWESPNLGEQIMRGRVVRGAEGFGASVTYREWMDPDFSIGPGKEYRAVGFRPAR